MPFVGLRLRRDTRIIEVRIHGAEIPDIDNNELQRIVDETVSRYRADNKSLCQDLAEDLAIIYQATEGDTLWAECSVVDHNGIMYGSSAVKELVS